MLPGIFCLRQELTTVGRKHMREFERSNTRSFRTVSVIPIEPAEITPQPISYGVPERTDRSHHGPLARQASRMDGSTKLALFEQTILPHLNAAYNLARWLTRNQDDAQDVVQEAYLRAFRFFDGFRGGNGKAWLLAVVRNTCLTWRRRERGNVTASAGSQAPGRMCYFTDEEVFEMKCESARELIESYLDDELDPSAQTQ